MFRRRNRHRECDVAIRTATPADLEAIARLHIASWNTAYRGLVPQDYLDGQKLAERVHLFAQRMASDESLFIVDERDGVVRGFCTCGPTRDPDLDPQSVWTIRNLHAAPEMKGRGVGAGLFDAAVAAARKAGAREMTLWVIVGNVPARAFYERKGMRADGPAIMREMTGGTVVVPELRYRLTLSS